MKTSCHHQQLVRGLLAALVLTTAGALAGCGASDAVEVDRRANVLFEHEGSVAERPMDSNVGLAVAPADAVQAPEAQRFADNSSSSASPDFMRYTPANAMIIRTGTATVEVDSLDPAIARVRSAAAAAGGYLADLAMHTGQQRARQATLQIKVPADRFDALLSAMDPIGTVQALDVSAQDVSEEFVDLRARVANDQRLEARLIELLDKRTGDLAEVLTVERELARVRQGIEQVEGRLRYLQERAYMSTLSIQLHEPGPLLTQVAGPNPIVIAVRQAWQNMIQVVAEIIRFTGAAIPFAVLALLTLLLWKRYRPEPTP